MASADNAASIKTAVHSCKLTSQSLADEDTDSTDRTNAEEKRSQKAPVQPSAEISAITGVRLLNASVPLQLPNEFAAADSNVQKSNLIQIASTASGSSVDESPNTKGGDPIQTTLVSPRLLLPAEGAIAQERDFTATILPQLTSDRTGNTESNSDRDGAPSAQLTVEKEQIGAPPDAPIQKGTADGTSQSPDSGIASQMNLALESVLTNSQTPSDAVNLGRSTTKPAQSKNTGGAISARTDAAMTRIQAKTGALDPVSPPASGNQSAQMSTQHSPVDTSQSSATTAKTSDASVLQGDFVPRPPAHDTRSPAGTDAGADLRRGGAFDGASQNHLDSAATAQSSGISVARVMQTMGESEMRVGIRSVEFGDISIRTSVSQQQLVAQITVDHHDLGSAISSHISAAQAKLGNDYGIHASIEVNQSGASFSGNQQNPGQQAQRQSVRSMQSPRGSVEAETNRANPIPAPALNDAYRLDIQA
jgi:hypothetical protein